MAKLDFNVKEINVSTIQIPDKKYREVEKDKDEYEKLKQSIATHGVQMPIIVRDLNDGVFELVDGLQRLSISQLLNLEMIPAKITKGMTDDQVMVIQHICNDARIKTSPRDKCEHLLRFMSLHPDMSQNNVSEFFGMRATDVSNILSLTRLEASIAVEVDNGNITAVKAYHLSRLPKENQAELLSDAIHMPTDEFGMRCQSMAKDIRKGRKPDKDAVVPHPLTRGLLIELYDKYHMDLETSDPEQGDYGQIQGRFEAMQIALQLDPATLARKKQERDEKKGNKSIEALQRSRAKINEEIAELQAVK